jgi:hypothetical protein
MDAGQVGHVKLFVMNLLLRAMSHFVSRRTS